VRAIAFALIFQANSCGGNACHASTFCPNDEPVSTAQNTCDMKSCAMEASALDTCVRPKITCDAKGKTSTPSLVAAYMSCSSQATNYDGCIHR